MLKKVSKIFEIILNILTTIIFIIVLIVGYNLVQTKVLNKDYTNLFGYTISQVATGSMSGSIEVKDIVVTKILSQEQIEKLEVNDIVVFKQEDYMVIHRIVEIEDQYVITKGDANNTVDAPIKKEDIIGQAVKIIHNVGIWENVFTTPKVYISIIITIFLFGITFSFNGNFKRKEKVSMEEKASDEQERI